MADADRPRRGPEVELVEHDARSAHWIARYTFTQTGRPVVNDVHAEIRVEDGLIVDHVDRLQLLGLVAPGARHARGAARLDADAARQGRPARPARASISS